MSQFLFLQNQNPASKTFSTLKAQTEESVSTVQLRGKKSDPLYTKTLK